MRSVQIMFFILYTFLNTVSNFYCRVFALLFVFYYTRLMSCHYKYLDATASALFNSAFLILNQNNLGRPPPISDSKIIASRVTPQSEQVDSFSVSVKNSFIAQTVSSHSVPLVGDL